MVTLTNTSRTLVLALLPALGACRNAPTNTPGSDSTRVQEPRPLRAVLFGYIPDAGQDDFAGLIKILEDDFEAQHPDIDLRLVIDVNIDLYDLAPEGQLATYFGAGEGSVDVLELDMVLLGDLVANGWLAPARIEVPEIVAAAQEAVTQGGTSYGVPTYLCGNFIYSHAPGLEEAHNASELLAILGEAAGPDLPALIGNYVGSWTLPSVYLDAWADGHDNAPDVVQTAYALPLDDATMGPLGALAAACASDGKNPCLDSTFKYNSKAEETFARGQSGGFIGYSERLYYIITGDPAAALPKVISAPMSDGSKPTLFTDALVTSAKCSGPCRDDADLFISFMSDLERRQLIAFSQDVPENAPTGVTPRYLLQALSSFYTAEPAASDPIYRALQPTVTSEGRGFPSHGFPEARGDLNSALTEALKTKQLE